MSANRFGLFICLLIAMLQQPALSAGFSTPVNCKIEWEDFMGLKQFMYRVDGNLPAIKYSKLKYFDSVSKKLFRRNQGLSEDQQEKLFDELMADADYAIYEISKKTEPLVYRLERFEGWIPDRDSDFREMREVFISGKRKKEWGPHKVMGHIRTAYELSADVKNFFNELKEYEERLKRLAARHLVDRSLGPKTNYFEYALFSRAVESLAHCQVSELGSYPLH